jgi:hypothetical protein
MMQWWEWNYDLIYDVAAFKVYSLRLVSISVSISVELLRSHIILIVTNMDINISCLFQDSNIVFNWHDIITTLGHHESSLWHHYETWLCHSSPSWWNLQLHHQKQLHRSEKLHLLPNQREVKKQTRGKKTQKTSSITARMVIFTGEVECQQYGRTLHMLICSVTPCRNFNVRLPLTRTHSMELGPIVFTL